jgi:hypothetical protein
VNARRRSAVTRRVAARLPKAGSARACRAGTLGIDATELAQTSELGDVFDALRDDMLLEPLTEREHRAHDLLARAAVLEHPSMNERSILRMSTGFP